MNTTNVTIARLIRYSVIVAHLSKPKSSRKGKIETQNQQLALASWLACASKVVLLNRPEDVAHLEHTKGVIFDERFSSGAEMPTPTVADMLKVLAAECPSDGFGVIPAGNTLLDPDGCKVMNNVRIQAQLSKAWAAVDFGPVLFGEDSAKVGEAVSAFWVSKQVAKYIADTVKNPPFANEQTAWVEWLGQALTAKVLGHRYFDATPHALAFSLSAGGDVPVYAVQRPFTKH